MNFKSIFFYVMPLAALTSCSDDDASSTPSNYEVPTSYTFERNGQNTVDYSDATARLKMLLEFDTYAKNVAGYPTFDAQKVTNMFPNTASPFSEGALNTSGVQLRDNTGSSTDLFGSNATASAQVKAYFDGRFAEIGTIAANYATTAAPGVGGSADAGKRLVNGKGLEINQAIIKGLMGACFLDQTIHQHLSPSVLDQTRAANDAGTVANGKNYTAMEHEWDQAYGFIFGYNTTNTDGTVKLYFWESYLNTVNGNPYFAGITDAIKNAFIKGRAAIVNKDYATRDAQIKIIREKLSLAVGVRTVFYLNEGKLLLSGDAAETVKSFHGLSESYGFITCLSYTYNPATNAPYFSLAEINTMRDALQGGTNGYWDANYTSQKADELMATIAQRFGFTVEQGIHDGGSH